MAEKIVRKSARDVITETASRYGLTLKDMQSPRRTNAYARPRQEAYFEAYVQCPHMSLPAIGAMLGGRDHTTIRHGIIEHGKRIGVDYNGIKRTGPRIIRGSFNAPDFVPSSPSQYRELVRL